MQHLEQRRSRIRLPVTEIAAKAGVDKTTVHRALRGERDTRGSKAEAIERAIEGEELDLLKHLSETHPAAPRAA